MVAWAWAYKQAVTTWHRIDTCKALWGLGGGGIQLGPPLPGCKGQGRLPEGGGLRWVRPLAAARKCQGGWTAPASCASLLPGVSLYLVHRRSGLAPPDLGLSLASCPSQNGFPGSHGSSVGGGPQVSENIFKKMFPVCFLEVQEMFVMCGRKVASTGD
jgi:hypothetical protein